MKKEILKQKSYATDPKNHVKKKKATVVYGSNINRN